MLEDVKARIKAPSSSRAGEVVEIKTLISHPMESGRRRDTSGNLIPRKIINTFSCSFKGRQVIEAKFEPSVSANPYLSFSFKASESGTLEFLWLDDDGSQYTAQHEITVS